MAGETGSHHHHSTTDAADSVDLSTSPMSVPSQPVPAVVDGDDDGGDDSPRLTAVYVQSKKSSVAAGARPDDVIGKCASPASSSTRPSPSGSSHQAQGLARHRQTIAVSRTLPHISDGGVIRQRVSFQVSEPRSQSSTCIAAADARPRRLTDAAVDDHHRTSSVDDMRTSRTPDRSPKQLRRAVPTRHGVVDVTARGAADSGPAPHDVNNALGEITSSSTRQSDVVD